MQKPSTNPSAILRIVFTSSSVGRCIPIELFHPAVRAEDENASACQRWLEIERDKRLPDYFPHIEDVDPILAFVAHRALFGFPIECERFGFRHADVWRRLGDFIRNITDSRSWRRRGAGYAR